MSDMPTGSVQRRLALPVAWRVLTELVRRHGASNSLRIIQTHPGISVDGQLVLLINPRPETMTTCPQIVLNIGGSSGTFEIRVGDSTTASGDYLWPTLAQGLGYVLQTLEYQMGWKEPVSLPPSSNQMLTLRLVSELLSGMWLDRNTPGIEFAAFDSSSYCSVMSWSSVLGVDVTKRQAQLGSGQETWTSICLSLSGLFRLAISKDLQGKNEGWVFDMDTGRACWAVGDQMNELIHLPDAYQKSHRRLEPIAARMLERLRQG